MPWLEVVAVFFYLVSVILTIKRNVWCWPTGIIAVTAYLVFFYEKKYYANMGLQVVYIAQCAYGWYYWKRALKNDMFLVRGLTLKTGIYTLLFIGVLTGLMSFYLGKFTDDASPFWDSFVSAISFVANWLLARKIFENWILWIISDAIYIGIFYFEGDIYSYYTYIVFLILSIKGFLDWKKELALQRV